MINNKVKTAGAISLATAMLLGVQVSAAQVGDPWEEKDDDTWVIRSDFEFEKADELISDEIYHIKLSKDNNDLDLYRFVPEETGNYKIYISDLDANFLIGILDYENSDLTVSDIYWYNNYEDDSHDNYDFKKGKTYYIFAWTSWMNISAEYDLALVKTGWRQLDGTWYYVFENGTYAEGWEKIDGKWYYFDDNEMQTGWIKDGGKWYYLNSSGDMATGWIKDGGSWYFLKTSGEMAENEYCNGYWLGNGGKWTYEARASWKKDSKGWYYQDTTGWYAKNATYKIDGKNYNFDSAGYCTNP